MRTLHFQLADRHVGARLHAGGGSDVNASDAHKDFNMLRRKFLRIAALPMLLYLCFLAMMAIHESGHVLHAWLSGGRIERIEFGFFEFSRTDLSSNPRPQFVA